MAKQEPAREGSLDAPTRRPIDWRNPEFYDEPAVLAEMERIFDICHGCRRCFNLCNAFPTLFDLVDSSETLEVDGVAKADYWKVVDQCYLCDMCFMTKCPYVPPHPWNVDFPKLMLRGKAVKFRQGRVSIRDKLITNQDLLGKLAGIPVVSERVTRLTRNPKVRKLLHERLGIHAEASLPRYVARTLKQRIAKRAAPDLPVEPTENTRGKVALFGTCFGNNSEPELGEDLIAVFEHNGIPVTLAPATRCCGMPRLEIGDLESIEKTKNYNVPILAKLVDEGWDLVAPVPSCVLMFKMELPLLFGDDPQVNKVARAMFDPFEYLMLRHKAGRLDTRFKNALGRIAYHVPCHLRVQNLGQKTRELLGLVPDTQFTLIERCAGHDGTYAVRAESYETAMKIGKPVCDRVKKAGAHHYTSDCPLAGYHVRDGLKDGSQPEHPLALLRLAYGI